MTSNVSAGPAEVDPATASVFRDLADLVYAHDDFDQVHDAVVRAAPRVVEGCDHASLMVGENGRFVTASASDDVARRVDGLERETGQGPCIEAITEDSCYHEAELATASRWPQLAERVLTETPVRSTAGFRLRTSSRRRSALNLFSDRAGGLDRRAVDQGLVLASFASVALSAAEERRAAATLRAGLESNREIGKAIGLLMAFHSISDEAAFAMLRTISQDLNVKLAEVAREYVAHHNRA